MEQASADEQDLLTHCCDGNEPEVRQLLIRRVRVDCCDESGATPLHMCAFFGHTNIAELLLKKNADTYLLDEEGKTALDDAVSAGNTEVAELIEKFRTQRAKTQPEKQAERRVSMAGFRSQRHLAEQLKQHNEETMRVQKKAQDEKRRREREEIEKRQREAQEAAEEAERLRLEQEEAERIALEDAEALRLAAQEAEEQEPEVSQDNSSARVEEVTAESQPEQQLSSDDPDNANSSGDDTMPPVAPESGAHPSSNSTPPSAKPQTPVYTDDQNILALLSAACTGGSAAVKELIKNGGVDIGARLTLSLYRRLCAHDAALVSIDGFSFSASATPVEHVLENAVSVDVAPSVGVSRQLGVDSAVHGQLVLGDSILTACARNGHMGLTRWLMVENPHVHTVTTLKQHTLRDALEDADLDRKDKDLLWDLDKLGALPEAQRTKLVGSSYVPWDADKASRNVCFRCSAKFGISRRRHHCRRCGHVCCGTCTRKKVTLPWAAYEDAGKQRVCSACADRPFSDEF